MFVFFFFKQKTAYEMRISDWSSDVCSSDLGPPGSTETAHDRQLVLGQERSFPRVFTALLQENEQNAQHPPSRRLFRNFHLSESRQGRRQHRCRRNHG